MTTKYLGVQCARHRRGHFQKLAENGVEILVYSGRGKKIGNPSMNVWKIHFYV